MAVANLKETVKKMVEDRNKILAVDGKKIDWLPSRDTLVRSLDSQLNDGKIKVEEAMLKIRSDFHKEVVNKLVDEFSFFRAMEKEIKYRLSK